MDGLSLALIPVIRRLLQVLAWDFPASIVQYGTKDWYIMCAQYRTKLGNTEIRYLKSTVYVTNIYQYWIICNSMEWNCSSFVDWSNQPTCDFSRTMPSCVSMWRISRALFVTEPGFLVFPFRLSSNMDDFALKSCDVLLIWPPLNLVAEPLEENVEPWKDNLWECQEAELREARWRLEIQAGHTQTQTACSFEAVSLRAAGRVCLQHGAQDTQLTQRDQQWPQERRAQPCFWLNLCSFFQLIFFSANAASLAHSQCFGSLPVAFACCSSSNKWLPPWTQFVES